MKKILFIVYPMGLILMLSVTKEEEEEIRSYPFEEAVVMDVSDFMEIV